MNEKRKVSDLVERLLRQRYYSGVTDAAWYEQAASEVEALEKRIAELEVQLSVSSRLAGIAQTNNDMREKYGIDAEDGATQ